MLERPQTALAVGLCFLLCTASAASSTRASAPSGIPFQRGVTVGEWGPTAYGPEATRATLLSLSRDQGVRSVTLFVAWMQDGLASTAIRPGGETVGTQNLVQAIREAKALGLQVILRPYVDLVSGDFRGYIRPRSIDAWFSSYDRFILKYADLAQQERIDGFVIGTEMKSVSRYAARWRTLARDVRSRFHGFVTYEANWDEYQTVSWWDALDAIDVSAYFPVAKTASSWVADLVKGWAPWQRALGAVQRRFSRPVIFGEIGYRTINDSAMRPWDSLLVGQRDLEDQARAFEAAFRAWYHVPWFRGFEWWYVAPQPSLVANRRGADYRPGTRALAVLGRWYRTSP